MSVSVSVREGVMLPCAGSGVTIASTRTVPQGRGDVVDTVVEAMEAIRDGHPAALRIALEALVAAREELLAAEDEAGEDDAYVKAPR